MKWLKHQVKEKKNYQSYYNYSLNEMRAMLNFILLKLFMRPRGITKD